MARTAKQRAALRKAQLASARKRRGKGKGKLAKANRATSRARKAAVVAATGGLALAAVGVAGAYYARKTAGGGPKAKKINHSSHAGYQTRTSAVPTMTRHNALRAVTGARWGDIPAGRRTLLPQPRKRSVDPGFTRRMGKPFTGDRGFSMRPSKPFTGDPGFTRRVGAPRSGSVRASSTRSAFDFSRQIPNDRKYWARHRMADKANRQRGLAGYIPSKAKFDRRRTKAQRKKYPRV